MDHAHGGVEVMIDKCLLHVRRIFTDDQGSRSMRVDMIGAVLRVVFDDEDGRVVPVGTM